MGILRKLVEAVAGTAIKPPAKEPSVQPWREAPTKEVRTDVGYGVTATMSWPTGPHGFVQVVGESHYQDTLKSLDVLFDVIGRTERVFTVKLVPEPTNQFDPNAVAVYTEGDAKVGYLSRDLAKGYHAIVAAQSAPVMCPAQLVGGESEKPNLGVVLDFEQIRTLKA